MIKSFRKWVLMYIADGRAKWDRELIPTGKILAKDMAISNLNKQKTILVLCNSIFVSGAEKSLYDFIAHSKYKHRFILSQQSNNIALSRHLPCKFFILPYKWFYKTLNPFTFVQLLYSLIVSAIRLYLIVNKNNVQIIYANTFKSAIFGLLVNFITNTKLICHVRDNAQPSILKNIMIKNSNALISISEHIQRQFPSDLKSNYLIYGGIDIEKWNNVERIKAEVMENLDLNSSSIIIACIGQLTRWKNQADFIHVANVISAKYHNIHFLIVGDDLSGREKRYKNELLKLVENLNLEDKIHFLGQREDLKEVMNSIDILVHPAIDEPFGRVLIEAMALEKPIVAYNCGGPAEIIIDGETGFLVEPYNFQKMAEKTIKLIEDEKICIKMGKAGRQRVVDKFNINRYVKEMEAIFDSLIEL